MEPTFETAMEGLEQMGASVGERELVEMLRRHGEEEGVLLQRYERYATEASSPAVRYLVGLLLEDETRHHRLLVELANAIAWGWSANSPVPATPGIYEDSGQDDRLAAETNELLAFEEQDEKELRRLRNQLRDYRDTTMWSLVVETMLADTQKHAHILRFIARHLT